MAHEFALTTWRTYVLWKTELPEQFSSWTMQALCIVNLMTEERLALLVKQQDGQIITQNGVGIIPLTKKNKNKLNRSYYKAVVCHHNHTTAFII